MKQKIKHMIKFKPAIGMSVAVIISTVILLALGQWQLQRLYWKNELVSQLQTAKQQAPLDIAGIEITSDLAWKKVSVTGHYRMEYPLTRIYGISNGLPGYRHLNVFETVDGRFLFVVRGFVPDRDGIKIAKIPNEQITLTGLLRSVGSASWLTPVPDLKENIWYRRDLPSMATTINLQENYEADFTLDLTIADSDKQWPNPVGEPPRPVNNHLDYALTWFGMALVLWVIYLVWHFKNGRLSFGRD
ncbi:SURF1 family protein [Oceanicaulis sp. AH-315-P02]|nr:SURF1 family protein [Oceanicaulis sp. AH-315-P02]